MCCCRDVYLSHPRTNVGDIRIRAGRTGSRRLEGVRDIASWSFAEGGFTIVEDILGGLVGKGASALDFG